MLYGFQLTIHPINFVSDTEFTRLWGRRDEQGAPNSEDTRRHSPDHKDAVNQLDVIYIENTTITK